MVATLPSAGHQFGDRESGVFKQHHLTTRQANKRHLSGGIIPPENAASNEDPTLSELNLGTRPIPNYDTAVPYCSIEQHSPWRTIAAAGANDLRSVSVIVNAEDYEHLNQYRWLPHTADRRGNVKVYRNATSTRNAKKIWMHHEVARRAGEPWQMVYHRNGYTLDNRRCNLREFHPSLHYLEGRRYYPAEVRELHKLKVQRLKAASMLQALSNSQFAIRNSQLKGELEEILQVLQP